MSGIKDTIKDALGFGGPKIRYAVVALGDISQRAFMPGVARSGNSTITALVTGDPEKATELAKEYKVEKANCYRYEDFDKLIQAKVVDAIYLATPNWRHAEFAVPALKAGLHVLLEKPMEISTTKCEEILAAQKAAPAGTKLMIAYRLHFEPATIEVIERVRKGDLGAVTMFNSTFAQSLDPKNHRAHNGWQGGPLFDMGTYPLNAVRNVFGDEPIEVSAVGSRHPESGFGQDFDDTVAVTLTFPKNRIAQFVVSYYGNITDAYTVVGTKGCVHVSPAYMYDCALEFNPYAVGQKKSHEKFKDTDHFAGQTKYFSECIINNTEPEADGEEGWCDIRVLEAALKSAQSGGQAQKLEPYTRKHRIEKKQEQTISHKKEPSPSDEVNAQPPIKM